LRQTGGDSKYGFVCYQVIKPLHKKIPGDAHKEIALDELKL